MIDFLDKKSISYKEIEDILSVSDRLSHYTNDGPVKRMLESFLHSLLSLGEDKRVLCCSSGTAALHSIMYLCTAKYGTQKWVTPAFTFPSCVVGRGFDVDILDISPKTYTLSLDADLSKYDGIVLTNLFGSYIDLDRWTKFCKDNDKALILDNAASPLSLCDGINICNFGDYSFGSLHHTKYLGFGEGGFVVCPEEDYDTINSMTNFGFHGSREYNPLSSNFKMSDVSAAFILSHIINYDVAAHVENQNKLAQVISEMDRVKLLNYKEGTVYNTLPVVFDRPISENCFTQMVTHKYYLPLQSLGNSVDLYNRIINFPLYANLTECDIETIFKAIGVNA